MPQKITVHRDYRRYFNAWLQIEDLVDGDLSLVSKYLIRYKTEEAQNPLARASFNSRVARLVYDNLCDPVLTIHLAHLSQKCSWGGLDSDKMAAIRDNATGMGDNAEAVAREILFEYLKSGMVGILVDSPPDASLPSYQVVYPALSVRNWTRFTSGPRRGQFSYVCLQDPHFVGADGKVYDQIRELRHDGGNGPATFRVSRSIDVNPLIEVADTRRALTNGELLETEWMDRDYEIVEEGDLGVDIIPFEMMGCGRDESVLKDVYQDARAIMNKQSAKDNILYYQAFQRLLGAGMKAEEVAAWSENIVAIAQDPTANIQVVDPADPAALDADIERMKARALRKGLMQHNQLVEDTRQVQSAESKTKDMVARIKFYDQTLDMLERKLKTVYQFHALFEDENVDEINIKFARDYGLEDESTEATEDALIYSQAGQLGVVEIQKEILRKYVTKMQIIAKPGQSNDDRLAELMQAIDAAQGNARSALPGLTTTGQQFQRTTISSALSDGGQPTA